MLKNLSLKLSRFTYLYIAKPILFRMSPDRAHRLMIDFVSWAGKYSAMRFVTKAMFATKSDHRLRQSYHGIDFLTPVGLSAGLDKNGEIIPMIAQTGFGFATVGSVTASSCGGNPRPWFHRLPATKSLVVNAGLPNDGSDVIIERIEGFSDQQIGGFPIALSVAKTNSCEVVSFEDGIKDYITTIKRAKKSKRIQALELNISCPNAYGGEPFTSPDKLEKLLAAVDKLKVKQPIFVKMPSELPWKEYRALLEIIVSHGVAGVTVSNLAKKRVNVNPKDSLDESIKGNLSGLPTQSLSNDLIAKTYKHFGDKLTIIGVGGIFTAEDAYAKIRLGASLVELITGVIFCGPQLVSEINTGLIELLKRDGYEHISEAIGVEAR
jgi:dihydroorotate dehydrogenase